jgi:hypothetical protein
MPGQTSGSERHARRRVVAGVDASFSPFHNITVDGSYTTSEGEHLFVTTGGLDGTPRGFPNRNAADVGVTGRFGNLGVTARYQDIGGGFDAPGYWNSIGRVRNLKNIRGWNGILTYALGAKTKFTVDGARWSQPLHASGVSNDVEHLQAGISYSLTPVNSVDLGVELANWYQDGPGVDGAIRERFFNIGFGHNFGPNVSMRVLLSLLETGTSGIASGFDGSGTVAVTQFTVRF